MKKIVAKPSIEWGFWRGLALALIGLLAGCGDSSGPVEPPPPDPEPQPIAIPAQGTASTLDVGTWNLLYFGAQNNGPPDDRLQMARVRDVILGTDVDLWGVQEVTSRTAFAELLDRLPGYDGILANDSSVIGGSESYTGGEIKVGAIFKQSMVEVTEARVVLPELDHEFAGRPPLQLRVRLTLGAVLPPTEAVVVILHAKANSQTASWERRMAAAAGLKAHLDSAAHNVPVFVPGDWNDDVDESITTGRDTPYRNFVDAAPDWVFATEPLSTSGVTSIIGFDDVIDHILASDEAMVWYEEGSALVYRVDELIPGYREIVSDHLPVLVRFRPGGSDSAPAR